MLRTDTRSAAHPLVRFFAAGLVAPFCIHGGRRASIAPRGRQICTVVLVAAFFLAVSTPSSGAVVYTYQGNSYEQIFNAFSDPRVTPYTDSMSLSFSFELDAQLLPSPTTQFYSLRNAVSVFNFSDGMQTLDQTNATLTFLNLWVDSSGAIAQWLMIAEQVYPSPVNVGDLVRAMASQFDFSFAGRDISTVARCQAIGSNSLCGMGIVNSAFVDGAPGTWRTDPGMPPVGVAEPATLALLATGLVALLLIGGWCRRPRSKSG